MSILDTIETERVNALAKISAAASTADLEQVRIDVLGKKGTLTVLLRGMGQIPAEERGAVGKALNLVRDEVESALADRKDALSAIELEARLNAEVLDITLPGRMRPIGSQHLISKVTAEVVDIFRGLGYQVIDGREVETTFINFTALNAPEDHPSRSPKDTFYVVDRSGDEQVIQGESEVLLRPQTSTAQVHAMQDRDLPLYVLSPGRVYRRILHTCPSFRR